MVGTALTDNAGFIVQINCFLSSLFICSTVAFNMEVWCALDQTNRGGGLDTLFNVNCRTLFLFQKTQKKAIPAARVRFFLATRYGGNIAISFFGLTGTFWNRNNRL